MHSCKQQKIFLVLCLLVYSAEEKHGIIQVKNIKHTVYNSAKWLRRAVEYFPPANNFSLLNLSRNFIYFLIWSISWKQEYMLNLLYILSTFYSFIYHIVFKVLKSKNLHQALNVGLMNLKIIYEITLHSMPISFGYFCRLQNFISQVRRISTPNFLLYIFFKLLD